MNINVKYSPIYLSELEIEYPKFIEYLNNNKTFIINGSKYAGKSTIVKLYLNLLNYDYLLLDDPYISKENIIDKLQYTTKSVFSYFFDKKYVVVIDNFDSFDNNTKELLIKYSYNSQFIIITNKYLNPYINYVRIQNYSNDYLMNLYVIIYFLETNNNCLEIPEFKNIYEMFSILEFNINTLKKTKQEVILVKKEKKETKEETQLQNNYKFIYDKFYYEYNDLVIEKNFEKKVYILNKFISYSIFQHNLIYNFKDIDELADSYDNLINSFYFLENNNTMYNSLEYYPILSIIGTSYKLNNFKIYNEQITIKKKKNFKNNYNNNVI